MKIFNNNIDKIVQAYKKQEVKSEVKGMTRLNKKDQLSLSEEAKEYQVAMKALRNVPDIRTEKVEAIRHQIQIGTYKVDADKIVEKMFDSFSINERI